MLAESLSLDVRLPLTFNLIGYNWQQDEVDRSQYGHRYFDWLQTEDGVGLITINHHSIKLAKNQAILFHPGVPHRYQAASHTWQTAFLAFSGTMAQELTTYVGLHDYIVFPQLDYPLESFIQRTYPHFAADTPQAHIQQSAELYRFLMMMKQNYHTDELLYTQSIFSPIIEYISQHYMECITNERLSEITGYSIPYQTKIFRKYYGVTPLQYLNNFRLRKAEVLLLSRHDWNVQSISLAVGFRDISRFIQDFKRFSGFTPLKYRTYHLFG